MVIILRFHCIVVLLAFTKFSFLPNWNVLLSTFWQRITPTVGCISANKPSIASCLDHVLFSCLERSVEEVLTVPVLLALADYWSQGVWIIPQVPLMPGQSQWIAHGGVWWMEQGTEKISWGNTDIRLCSNYVTFLTPHGLIIMICWLC